EALLLYVAHRPLDGLDQSPADLAASAMGVDADRIFVLALRRESARVVPLNPVNGSVRIAAQELRESMGVPGGSARGAIPLAASAPAQFDAPAAVHLHRLLVTPLLPERKHPPSTAEFLARA